MRKAILIMIVVLIIVIVIVHIAFQLDLLFILKSWQDVAIEAL